jgi:ankyrin repeat protein
MQQGRRNQERHSGMLDYLMTQGIAKCKQPNGMTALFHALDSPVLVKTLLAQGADPNAVCLLTGETPFLHAIRECSYSFHLEEETENTLFAVCDLLIAQGADPLVQDKQGQTALHYAVSGGITNQRTLQYLADHHIPLDVQDQQGQTALHRAMTNIHLMATALWLLQNHANPHIVDQAGQLPLEKITYQSIHSSSYLEKKSKELPILLKSFINALPANKILANGTDLLLFAVDLNNKELAQAIFPHLTDINSLCQNTTAFNLAIQKGFSEMVAWLIEQGAQLNPCQESKNNSLSPLQQAVLSLNPVIAKQLLDAGANPKVVDQNNRSLLLPLLEQLSWKRPEFATFKSQLKTVFVLFQLLYPRLLVEDAHKKSFLEQALSLSDHTPAVWYFIRDMILDQDVVLEGSLQARHVLHLAILHRDKAALNHLMIQPDPVPGISWISLIAMSCIEEGDKKQLAELISKGLDINARLPIVRQLPIEYAFHLALEEKKFSGMVNSQPQKSKLKGEEEGDEQNAVLAWPKLVSYLIKEGADVHFPSAHLSTCLHAAVELGWLEVVETLLQPRYQFSANQFALSKDTFKRNSYPLEIAVEHEDAAMVQLLLAHKADARCTVYSDYRETTTLLHIACERGLVTIASLLIQAGADINAQRKSHFFLETPLHTALTNKQSPQIVDALVQSLLDNGARVDDHSLRCAITHPLDSKRLVAVLLDSMSIDRIIKAKPLHLAVTTQQIELVNWLLDRYSHELLHSRDVQGKMPIHLATAPGKTVIYHTLVQAGADIQALDYQGNNVTFYALCHNTLKECQLPLPTDLHWESFKKLRLQLIEEPEFTRRQMHHLQLGLPAPAFLAAMYSYKLIRLFGNFETAHTYIARYRDKNSQQPLHDLCLFETPTLGEWNKEAWAQLTLMHGPSILHYLHLAPRIESVLQRSPNNLEEISAITSQMHYNREVENPALAQLFAQYAISEAAFERILTNYRPKHFDRVPDLFIEGKEFNEPRYYFKKLRVDDLRGFILGAITHCCQSVGSAGEAYAMHGMTSTYGGFYALFKRAKPVEVAKYQQLLDLTKQAESCAQFIDLLTDKSQRKKYREWYEANRATTLEEKILLTRLRNQLTSEWEKARQDEIIAQSWAWLSTSGYLVLDSWEYLRVEDERLFEPFLRKAAEQAIHCYQIEKVLLGRGGRTPAHLPFQEAMESETPVDYFEDRDSEQQWIIATSQKSHSFKDGDANSDDNSSRLQRYQSAASPTHTLSKHYGLFAAPSASSVVSYTESEMAQLLEAVISDNPRINVLEIMKAETSQEQIKNLTKRILAKENNKSIPYTYLVPILDAQGDWSCLLFLWDATLLWNKGKDPFVIYLNPRGYPIPSSWNQYFQCGGWHQQIATSNTPSISETEDSGHCLLAVVQHFASTGKIALKIDIKGDSTFFYEEVLSHQSGEHQKVGGSVK